MKQVVVLAFVAGMGFAQSGSAPGKKDIPRLHDGKADLNGVWQIPYTPDMSRGVPGGLPFSAWGEQEWKSYDAAKFDYTAHCLPAGLTRLVNTPTPLEIVQTPKKVAIIFEGFTDFIIVPTDGRKHSKDIDPAWNGHHIGWYEGDTLVIDSIGFNDRSRLDTIGHPHSDQMHVIQKLTRTDEKTIDFEITIDDPKTFTKSWSNKRKFTLRPDWELMEYSCMENNKDLIDGHIK